MQGDDPVEECQVPGDEGGVSIRDGVPCRQNLRKSHSTVAGLTIINDDSSSSLGRDGCGIFLGPRAPLGTPLSWYVLKIRINFTIFMKSDVWFF